MLWNFYDAVFFEQRVLRQHAVDAAAERAGMHVGGGFAARPALKEIGGDAVANLEAPHAGADLDHFAGAIRQRYDILAHRHPVAAARNAVITEIERAGFDLDENLPVGRIGVGPIDLGERLDTGAALRQLIGSHEIPPSRTMRLLPLARLAGLPCPRRCGPTLLRTALLTLIIPSLLIA